MLCHVGQHTFLVLQEADVAQLVHLVVADDHDREALADILHAALAAGNGRDTCAREGDLAGGSEHEHTVFVAVLLALVQQHRSLDDLIGQVMDDIGFIPEDLEIRRSGLHLGKTLDGLIAVGVAIGVGILRHTPDALDVRILGHQLFHNVHIRAIGGHRHADQLKAKLLGNSKVTVIAGHRAEELALLHLRPGARRLRETEHIADIDEVIHQLQAGVAAHEHFLRLYAKDIRKQHAGLLQAFQLAIVAGIRASIGGIVIHLQQVHGQIHLVRAGLAAGHIQLEALGLKFLVLCLKRCLFGSEFITIHCKIICH